MRSYITSYNGLFSRRGVDAPAVERIEIPIIQRDYAQGRDTEAVARIRASFLGALHEAVTTGKGISLDFVYGTVDGGTLQPLDGQQRLTTLFLLHWYLAWRADRLAQEQGWKRFSYATRASARLFCERLVGCRPPPDANVRAWLEDQSWFLHTWRHDPTIQSMLVMLEAIDQRFAQEDCAAAWARLVDPETPAISFHLLPIGQSELNEDLYIKMNSRGKPLTPFENFKARFEQVLEHSCPTRLDEFARKVDGAWADLLWPYRGSDDIVDDEFLRYFHFVTDVCKWHDGGLPSDDIEALAVEVYGTGNAKAAVHLDFLIRCFDTWGDADIESVFAELFSLTPAPLDSDETKRVVLFGPHWNSKVNLFAACCDSPVRSSLPRVLFLYAVLLHRLHDTPDFARRLRVLRNLIEASNNELRSERMPMLLVDVRRLIVEGAIAGIATFNQAQVADELSKADLLTQSPGLARHLFHLEDHPVLRGSVAAFELDGEVFERRARAFHEVFTLENLPLLTGALLAAGDYSRSRNRRLFQLGSGFSLNPWRELLTGASRTHLAGIREALGRLLDVVAARDGDVRQVLESFSNRWLETAPDAAGGRDWRWYFVKYPMMRAGFSGIYASVDGALGHRVCMLDKSQMNSWYRDPYLSAIHQESRVASALDDPWFTGYETAPRWMRLRASDTKLQCVQDGLLLLPPVAEAHLEAFSRVCAVHGVGPEHLLKVAEATADGRMLDTRDRIQLGAALVRDLVDAGL